MLTGKLSKVERGNEVRFKKPLYCFDIKLKQRPAVSETNVVNQNIKRGIFSLNPGETVAAGGLIRNIKHAWDCMRPGFEEFVNHGRNPVRLSSIDQNPGTSPCEQPCCFKAQPAAATSYQRSFSGQREH